jgi:hypothetical protein
MKHNKGQPGDQELYFNRVTFEEVDSLKRVPLKDLEADFWAQVQAVDPNSPTLQHWICNPDYPERGYLTIRIK